MRNKETSSVPEITKNPLWEDVLLQQNVNTDGLML
jgi:hypothetical protein